MATFEPFIIHYAHTIEDALCKIEENKSQTLIVLDENNRVVGTLTDGDIRKALISKRILLAPIYDIMNTHYYFVLQGEEHKAHEIFNQHFYINLIPVITEQRKLKNIIARNNILDAVMQDTGFLTSDD